MIFHIGTENTTCDISNALYFITDQKSQTKTKIGGHLCPQGSKIGFQYPKFVLRPYFQSLRTQIASNFHFCMWFLISDKIQSVWYIIRRIFCANLENRFFYPILQYCQFLRKTVPRLNGQSEKVPVIFFHFYGENCIGSNIFFQIRA